MTRVQTCLKSVYEKIREAELRYGRTPGSVELLAVSKGQPVVKIREAVSAGQRAFGENYLQEALPKIEEISNAAISWHFIGHIQSNKTRLIAESFDWVHSVDSLRHARRLDAARPPQQEPLNICLQINLAAEATKGGMSPQDAAAAIDDIAGLERLRLRGLMTLPPPADDFQLQREPFARLRRLRDELRRPGLPLDTLSMGMSNDLEAAIAEGATLVRVGTAIFGPRGNG